MSKGSSTKGREEYSTSYKVGQDNVQFFGLDVHNPVFGTSAIIVLLFVVCSIVFPTQSRDVLMAARGWSINNFDWFFMIAGNLFVLFCLLLIFLPMGRIRLGGTEARPEHSTIAWFCMLFAAGMGIGLMFWSVAEPVAYFTGWYGTPLNAEANTPEAARLALGATGSLLRTKAK